MKLANFGFGSSGGGSGSGKLTQDVTATVAVGGVDVGDFFADGTAIEDVIIAMIAPYVVPIMSGLAVVFNPVASYYEVGHTVDITSASWSITNDSEGNPPQNMNLAGDGFNMAVTGTSQAATPGSTTVLNAPGSKTWTLTGEDKDSNPITPATYSKSWRWKYYFGAVNNANPTNDGEATTLALALQQSQLLASKVATFVCTADNDNVSYYTWIVYLASFGALSNIIQNGALPVLTAFSYIGAWNVTNTYGQTASFRFYKSNSTGAFASGTSLAIS